MADKGAVDSHKDIAADKGAVGSHKDIAADKGPAVGNSLAEDRAFLPVAMVDIDLVWDTFLCSSFSLKRQKARESREN